MSEQLKTNGTIISVKNNVEVRFISKNGLILLVGDTEYYLPYGKFHGSKPLPSAMCLTFK